MNKTHHPRKNELKLIDYFSLYFHIEFEEFGVLYVVFGAFML